jgi:hypothetical protein
MIFVDFFVPNSTVLNGSGLNSDCASSRREHVEMGPELKLSTEPDICRDSM